MGIKLGTYLSNAHRARSVTYFHGFVRSFAEDNSTNEASCKHISSAVGVHDLVFGELGNRVCLHQTPDNQIVCAGHGGELAFGF
jgi:hypothetical protein